MAERISNPTEQRLILKDGRTLGFAEYGDPKGEPMLEFHGCPSSRLEARNYDEAGKKLGARVIGIDRPGFGISTYVKGYRTVDWPADVIEFADALGLNRFVVAGISSGSPYALACARFIPERLKGCAVVSGVPRSRLMARSLTPASSSWLRSFSRRGWRRPFRSRPERFTDTFCGNFAKIRPMQ